jgi:N-acetylglucosamine-6-phosphate deacetylase
MILKNAKVFDENFNLQRADIQIEKDKIEEVGHGLSGEDELDLSGCIVSPGFVDIHIHGCVGADTCDGTREALSKMASHLIEKGVTSFCPTTMTVSLPEIRKALSAVRDCMDNPPQGATILGVNMEGPYISPNRKGAQSEEFVRRPDAAEFRRLYDECGGIIRFVDVAPEQDGADDFIREAKEYCCVSMAHTDADYDQAKRAFGLGITHVTHLFNAMNGLNHRAPGAVGAVFDDDTVSAEIICDGFHIHPAVLRTAFRLLGENRTVVISDSMRAAGLPDGVSELGGQTVYVKDGRAHLADGTIAGSTTNLYDEVRKLVRFGVPLRQVIRSVTINPAREARADREIGSIAPGKIADLNVFDEELNLKMVIAKGKILLDRRCNR